jgi:site-specific recombinase XerD
MLIYMALAGHATVGEMRGGTDLVTVAKLLGHAHLETVRIYMKTTEEDKVKALDHLIVDE